MKYLLEIAEAIATNRPDVEIHKITQNHKVEIEEEVTKLSDKDADEIVGQLFPNEISINTKFYDVLQKFQHCAGCNPAFYLLAGRIWAIAYNSLEQDKRKALLDLVFQEKGRGVWRAIHYLPEFCSRVDIEPQFAAGWFYRFGDRVKDDMANGDFFNGVKNYASHFPISGMKVFETYISEPLDELKINLAALLLGTVRSKAAQGHYKKDIVAHWDKQIRTSSQINMRLIYHRSLPTSFDMGSLSVQELDNELTTMMKGEPEEISEAFSIVWRCLRSELADDDFVRFAIDWFSKNTSSKLPDAAKYHLVNAMWFFNTPGQQKKDIKASETDDLLVAIQPIPENNRGTWEYFEMYLVERLHKNVASFGNILGRFVEANPKGMLTKFQGEFFKHLQSEICSTKEQDFLTKWLLSADKNKRKIAKAIFQRSESIVLSQNTVSEASEEQLEIALLEFIRRPLLTEKTSEYLTAFEPAFRNVSPELKQKFKNEMILQAINYPGACLDNWKKIEKPSDLLKEVITNAEKYFERLKAIKDSPAISFSFPGCKEAVEREASEFSNKVTGEAKDRSIFTKLAKNVHVIYGTRWSIMMEGKLGGAQDFNELKVSMEFPRLEIIDPEGMAIRRIQAARNIKGVEGGK